MENISYKNNSVKEEGEEFDELNNDELNNGELNKGESNNEELNNEESNNEELNNEELNNEELNNEELNNEELNNEELNNEELNNEELNNLKINENENEEKMKEINNAKGENIKEEKEAGVNENIENEREGFIDNGINENEQKEDIHTKSEETKEMNQEEKKQKPTKKKKKLRKFKETLSKKRKYTSSSDEKGTEEKEEKGEKEGTVKDVKHVPIKKKKLKKILNDRVIENEFMDIAAEEKDESESETPEDNHESDRDYEVTENVHDAQNERMKNKTKNQTMNKKKKHNSKEINRINELDFYERRSEIGRSDEEKSETNKLKKKKTHFDEILENLKLRKKKRQTMSEDECIQYCEGILKQMVAAHEQDIKSIKGNRPATAKLQMVDNICKILTKPKWKPYFMKLNINRVLEMWLMPITKNTLPHFSIRSNLLKVIMQLPITIKSLRGSQLGKVLTFLHTHKDETEENKKIIKAIMQNLLGPIIGVNANYKYSLQKRQKKIMENPNFHKIMLEKAKTLIPERISIEKEEEQNECKRHVTVPFNSECSFLINVPSVVPIENKRNQPKNKMKRLTENFNMINRIKKSQTVSIDGKEIVAAP